MTVTVGATLNKACYYENSKVQSGERMKIGLNGNSVDYSSTGSIFINLVKGGKYFNVSGNPPMDANGYIDCSSGGDYASIITSAFWVVAGTYVLTWEGTGNCTWNGGPEIDIGAAGYPTVNRREYSVATSGEYGNVSISLIGGSGTFTHIALYEKIYETEYLAGQILTPRTITNLGSMHCYRMLNWLQITDCCQRDVADLIPFDAIFWCLDSRECKWGNNVPNAIPIQAICQMMNELDTNIWFHIPAQATDALVTHYCTELLSGLDAGRLVYLEYGNEIWNSLYPFNGDFSFVRDSGNDITVYESESISGNTITVTNHGLNNGDTVAFYNNPTGPDSNHSTSQEQVVSNATTHTFEAGTIQNSTIKVRYKRKKDITSTDRWANYAKREVEVFKIARPILGDQLVTVAGARLTSVASDGWEIGKHMIQPEIRELADLVCVNTYTRVDDGLYDPDVAFENWSLSQLTDWYTQADGAYDQGVGDLIPYLMPDLGHFRLCVYEGGMGHNPFASGYDPAKEAKKIAYQESSECTPFYDHFYHQQAYWFSLHCQFNDFSRSSKGYGEANDSHWWGMFYNHETIEEKLIAWKAAANQANGGAARE